MPLNHEDSPAIAVALKGVSVGYGNGAPALDDISISQRGGSICAVLGANGSGKSTLCKVIMGIKQPQAGSVRVFGQPVRRALRSNAIAYVPQSEQIDWDFPVSVHDVVMMGRQGQMNLLRIPSREDKRLVAESLARVGMLDFAGRQIGELSGGQKKRVFIARGLAQRARMMLLDEPFTGVDVTTEKDILAILREERDRGMALMVVTHNLNAVPDYCDDVLMLNKRLIAKGAVSQAFNASNLAATYGGLVNELMRVVAPATAASRQRDALSS